MAACSNNFVSSYGGVPPQGLMQATLTYDEKTDEVEVCNHDQKKFNIKLDMLAETARHFDELCGSLPFITRRYASSETVLEDIYTMRSGLVTDFSELRLVVRKKNKMVYVSCGVYEMSRYNDRYYYVRDQTFRLDFFSDDLTAVVNLFLKRREQLGATPQ